MIIKAKERGDGAQLARYLLSMRENDHVELHEVRGFVSDDLLDLVSQTKCDTCYQQDRHGRELLPPHA